MTPYPKTEIFDPDAVAPHIGIGTVVHRPFDFEAVDGCGSPAGIYGSFEEAETAVRVAYAEILEEIGAAA